MRVGTSACASTAATSTEPEASSGGAERSAQTAAHYNTNSFPPPRSQRPLPALPCTVVALIEALHSNLAGSQQCIPLPSGGPQAQQAVVTGSGGAKQASRDDPHSRAADSTWSEWIRLVRHGSPPRGVDNCHLVAVLAISAGWQAAPLKCSYLERAASFLR